MDRRSEGKRTSDHELLVTPPDPSVLPLLPTFLVRCRERVATLERLLGSEDHASARAIAHDLAGSGGSFGLELLSSLGRSLETALQARDRRAADKVLDRLRRYLEEVRILPA